MTLSFPSFYFQAACIIILEVNFLQTVYSWDMFLIHSTNLFLNWWSPFIFNVSVDMLGLSMHCDFFCFVSPVFSVFHFHVFFLFFCLSGSYLSIFQNSILIYLIAFLNISFVNFFSGFPRHFITYTWLISLLVSQFYKFDCHIETLSPFISLYPPLFCNIIVLNIYIYLEAHQT